MKVWENKIVQILLLVILLTQICCTANLLFSAYLRLSLVKKEKIKQVFPLESNLFFVIEYFLYYQCRGIKEHRFYYSFPPFCLYDANLNRNDKQMPSN